jgi:cell division protein FtsL
MSKRKQEEKHLNAKQKAYEQKQARQGEKVVKWIFAVLVLLAFCFMVYSIWLTM